jgi:hypothetical protein
MFSVCSVHFGGPRFKHRDKFPFYPEQSSIKFAKQFVTTIHVFSSSSFYFDGTGPLASSIQN